MWRERKEKSEVWTPATPLQGHQRTRSNDSIKFSPEERQKQTNSYGLVSYARKSLQLPPSLHHRNVEGRSTVADKKTVTHIMCWYQSQSKTTKANTHTRKVGPGVFVQKNIIAAHAVLLTTVLNDTTRRRKRYWHFRHAACRGKRKTKTNGIFVYFCVTRHCEDYFKGYARTHIKFIQIYGFCDKPLKGRGEKCKSFLRISLEQSRTTVR